MVVRHRGHSLGCQIKAVEALVAFAIGEQIFIEDRQLRRLRVPVVLPQINDQFWRRHMYFPQTHQT